MSADLSTMTDDEFEKHMQSNPPVEDNTEDTEVPLEEEPTDTETDEKETGEKETEEGTIESQEADDATEDTETETKESTEETKDSVDYKAFYEQVTADYKANKKMMPGLKSAEDIRTALSMASNYALKTTALKPHMGRIKMLEGVSDEELNEMMDFKNRNAGVIKKALKDAGVDPLEMDMEDTSYSPTDYRISVSQLEFQEIIDELKDTPEFETTSKVVTGLWDEKSREEMIRNPELIRGLNEEIAMGRYEQVQSIIDQKRLLGKAKGLSDLELYQKIVTDMVHNAPKVAVPQPKVETVQAPEVTAQKKQAGINTKKKSDAVKKYDPTKLSDDEFMELMKSGAKFI